MAVLFLSSYVQAGEGKIAIIVNANSPLGNNISMDKVRDIYTGKIKFEGKTKIQPANQKDKGIFDEYLGKFVGMWKIEGHVLKYLFFIILLFIIVNSWNTIFILSVMAELQAKYKQNLY